MSGSTSGAEPSDADVVPKGVTVKLNASDIPGPSLSEPLETHTIPELKWCLLCHGIQTPSSWKKAQIITRIREAEHDKAEVVDVDGSYLYRKYQNMVSSGITASDPGIPTLPLTGWEQITGVNYREMAKKIPKVTHGLLYTYLAEGVGNKSVGGAFRALKRGFNHWASGRMDRLYVNYTHPKYCHIKCDMVPSMKTGPYTVYILLSKDGDLAGSIVKATCDCAAGLSASCTHVSGLLHALVSICIEYFTASSTSHQADTTDEEPNLPVTSYLCQWKAPQKRKESALKMSESTFEKHVYGRVRKYERKPLEDFDPRAQECVGKIKDRLPALLDRVRGKGLGISLLFDESTCYWDTDKTPDSYELPTLEKVKEKSRLFKNTLKLSPERIREIEHKTKDQQLCELWYFARRYRLTASNFGLVYHRLPTTPPDALVLRLLGVKTFSYSEATEWGKRNEENALKQYIQHHQSGGHVGLTVCRSGFVVCESHPFLGASPDANVYDPSQQQPFGVVEIKCPFSCRNMTPIQACSVKKFFCTLDLSGEKLLLKRRHNYYCQIQGQMAISGRSWCDFVIYTSKGLGVERINFDSHFWENELLPKLISFYDNCILPEIVSPVHALGLPIRDLSKV